MRTTRHNMLLLVLTSVLFVSGYAFLRYAYKIADTFPFTQEIILIVLGTLATVLITALLLNKQTEVELKKEQSIKFIELKAEVYKRLIDCMEDILAKSHIDAPDKVRLQFLAHRLAIVASPDVLFEFENLLDALDQPTESGVITITDSNTISRALGALSVKIRADLVGELDQEQSKYSSAEIERQISENVDEALDR